jgi:hypothetical protein
MIAPVITVFGGQRGAVDTGTVVVIPPLWCSIRCPREVATIPREVPRAVFKDLLSGLCVSQSGPDEESTADECCTALECRSPGPAVAATGPSSFAAAVLSLATIDISAVRGIKPFHCFLALGYYCIY